MMAGQLDQRISLLEKQEVNEGGSLKISYVEQATVWAQVISQKGAESFEAARVNARETVRIQIRYREADATMRVRWLGQDYNIIYIDRSARRDGALWMTCEVVGAQ